MGKERLGPPEHPAVSPVPRSSRDPFPVAAALDRGHSHETKGQSLCLICIGGRLDKAFLRILRGLFRGLLFGFLRGSLKALSKAPQLLNVISRQNHIWPVEREEYPEKRAIISAQSRFRLDADVDWMQFSAGCRPWLDAATRDSQPALGPTSTNRETCGLIAVPARAASHLPEVILGSFHTRLLLSRRFAEGKGRETP